MPNIKSAIKRVKVANTKTQSNIPTKATMRTAIKKIEKNIETKDKDALLKSAVKKIDKAVKKGIIKKNNAARKKARLTKMTNVK